MATRATWHASALILIVVLGLALRIGLLAADAAPFNGDEAVVALMAKHILQKGERPVFFYGQNYSGALDAYLTAGLYAITGPRIVGGRLVQMALFALYIVLVYALAERVTGNRWAALVSGTLVAASTPLLATYTLVSVGGYGESLVLGTFILWLSVRMAENWADRVLAWVALGAAGGVAFWVLGISVVYLIPAALFLAWNDRFRHWPFYMAACAAFVVFSSPWWIHDFTHSHASLGVLIDPKIPPFSIGDRIAGMMLLGMPALLGMRFPWEPDLILVPLAVLALALYLAVFLYAARTRRVEHRTPGRTLLLIQIGLYLVLFIGSRFGIDATGRYLLPLVAPLAVFTAMLIDHIRRDHLRAARVLFACLVAFNLAGIGLAAWRNPPGITTQFGPITRFDNRSDAALISFLLDHEGTRGYSNFWVTYRIAFESDERVILSARLPFKENLAYWSTDAGYAPYNRAAAESPTAVYVTSQHPVLDALLRERFAGMGITFKEEQIGPYNVFYALSRKVMPEELGKWQDITD